MGRASAISDLPLVRAIVVDGDRRVLESDVPALPIGAIVTRASWLGVAVLDAIHAASRGERSAARAARDDAQGTHWIVQATVASDGERGAPWRARVIIVDATLAVTNDRVAVLGKLVHSMQNAVLRCNRWWTRSPRTSRPAPSSMRTRPTCASRPNASRRRWHA